MRALLPVKVAEGHTVSFGVWLAIHPEDLKPAFNIWWDPACEHLHLGAWLGNAISPWGMLACPVEAAVRDPSQTPCRVSFPDETVNRVLAEEWDHGLVLEGIRAGNCQGTSARGVGVP